MKKNGLKAKYSCQRHEYTANIQSNTGYLWLDVSESLVAGITNKIMPEIKEWQKRFLGAAYPLTEYKRCIVYV